MTKKWASTVAGQHLRQRSKKNTEPERLLRSALHRIGARFRLHPNIAPGCTPDITLPRRRIAVFVDGDYWHSCPVHGRKTPFTGPNAVLWEEKMRRNRERDERSSRIAEASGWLVVRVWECTIRYNSASAARAVLAGVSPAPEPSARP
ncbi:very short patch repair endonuclease [Phytohabitans maris]|uniref:very short patch repair endonuclease n=1 Tax=Phytohabitans maris TaxID=3071409 RepID=UPI003D1754FF